MTTLAELKAENAEDKTTEVEETETDPQLVEEATEEAELEAVEEETEDPKEAAEPGEGETEETETEAWMQTDGDKKFTDGDIGAAKKKLRAKLESKHNEETDELKARIAQLEGSNKPAELSRPKRDDFLDSDDPDEAYTDALVDWKMSSHEAKTVAKTSQAEQTRQVEDRQRVINQDVDSHYERAAKLSSESGIAPELYQSSDLTVRRAVESVFPNMGDAITDGLIANLGEGSEKVFYNLGVNEVKRSKFISLLQSDNSGLKASIYLGKLHSELAAPTKRKTKAPKPAASPTGDANVSASNNAAKRKYDKAHTSGKTSEAFKIKREAKKAGVDTNSW